MPEHIRTCKRCEQPQHTAELALVKVAMKAPTSFRGFEVVLCIRCNATLECMPDGEVFEEIFSLHKKKFSATLEAEG